MTLKSSLYYDNFQPSSLREEFPIGSEFTKRFKAMSRDELRQRQNTLFLRAVDRAWKIPFYRRLWGQAGIEPGDIRNLDDIERLPSFGKEEIMESVARRPPFGDHHGSDIPVDGRRVPMIVHTTSGTTGRPQPLFFSPRTREVQALLLGRLFALQGVCANDVVQSVYGHGMINGGHYIREAFTKYTPAIFLSAGSGVETPSIKQIELMQEFGATVLTGFGDYLMRLGQVAGEQGVDPIADIALRRIIGHLSYESRSMISEMWGNQVDIYDWYGVGDTGAIAGEGPDHDGLYIMEDAQYVEICDVDSGAPVVDGETGDLVVTCLYIDDIFPIIRFNTHDITKIIPGASSLGLPFRRIAGFLGRSDNMVKIKGVNIFPQAIGKILGEQNDFEGDYVCILENKEENAGERLSVHIESRSPGNAEITSSCKKLLRHKLGVDLDVKLVNKGALSSLTGIETRQKPVRLVDRRETE